MKQNGTGTIGIISVGSKVGIRLSDMSGNQMAKSSQPNGLLTKWLLDIYGHNYQLVTRLVKVRLLDVSGNPRAGNRMPTVQD